MFQNTTCMYVASPIAALSLQYMQPIISGLWTYRRPLPSRTHSLQCLKPTALRFVILHPHHLLTGSLAGRRHHQNPPTRPLPSASLPSHVGHNAPVIKDPSATHEASQHRQRLSPVSSASPLLLHLCGVHACGPHLSVQTAFHYLQLFPNDIPCLLITQPQA